MNSVIAYKQFSLGEGLADLFASEVRNFEAFKASLISSAKNFRQLFEPSDWEQVCHDKTTHEKGCSDSN